MVKLLLLPAASQFTSRLIAVFQTLVLRKLEKISESIKDLQAKQNSSFLAMKPVTLNIAGLPKLPLGTTAHVDLFCAIMEEEEAYKTKVVIIK